jgi:hypothetical protein
MDSNSYLHMEPWFMGSVSTYRVNKHKDRRDIRQKTASRRPQTTFDRPHTTDIGGKDEGKEGLLIDGYHMRE